MEQWVSRLKSNKEAELTNTEREQLGQILKESKDWSPANKLRAITTLLNLFTLAGARRLLMPGSSVYLGFLREGLEAVDELQYRRYVINRGGGKSPEQAYTSNPATRTNYEVRYQFERLLNMLQNRTVPELWRLEVVDKTIDELWDKREYSYKVTNLGGKRICDFSLILLNQNVKGDAAGEMILQDSLVLPPGWMAKIGGNVISFETNDPNACISRNRSQEFTFRVWWKNYEQLGTVTASASILNAAGAHEILTGSEIGEFYGPVAVSAEPGRPPEGSRIMLTGRVVEGQPAVLTAVAPGGAVLSGVVLDVGGQQRTTDENGRVQVMIPAGLATVAATFGLVSGGGPTAVSNVIRGPAPGAGAPQITAVVPYATRGGEIAVSGEFFSPQPGQTGVRLGARELQVLAVSPVEVIASVPADMPLGDPGPLVVTSPSGTSNAGRVRVVGLRLESNSTRLVRGQRGKAQVILEGVTDRVAVRIRNASPNVIRLQGGESQVKTSSGGRINSIPLEFQSLSSGTFQIEASLDAAPVPVTAAP